jgi:hypothetical protein
MRVKSLLTSLFISSFAGAPAAASDETAQGLSLLERGAQLLLQGLMKDVEPALREFEGAIGQMQPQLRQFLLEMGPAFIDLTEKMGDLSHYEQPEMLPNGDIILRRKPEATPNSPAGPPLDDIEL